jgi:hypothetical protein
MLNFLLVSCVTGLLRPIRCVLASASLCYVPRKAISFSFFSSNISNALLPFPAVTCNLFACYYRCMRFKIILYCALHILLWLSCVLR